MHQLEGVITYYNITDVENSDEPINHIVYDLCGYLIHPRCSLFLVMNAWIHNPQRTFTAIQFYPIPGLQQKIEVDNNQQSQARPVTLILYVQNLFLPPPPPQKKKIKIKRKL